MIPKPEDLWALSRRQWLAGRTRRARLLKAMNFIFFHAVLPPEATVRGVVHLGHYGHGVVIHPNVTIGNDVTIWHNVTLSVTDSPGSASRLTIMDNVTIGTGVVVITRWGQSLTIGEGAVIGANSVVTNDVAPQSVVAGTAARVIRQLRTGESRRYR